MHRILFSRDSLSSSAKCLSDADLVRFSSQIPHSPSACMVSFLQSWQNLSTQNITYRNLVSNDSCMVDMISNALFTFSVSNSCTISELTHDKSASRNIKNDSRLRKLEERGSFGLGGGGGNILFILFQKEDYTFCQLEFGPHRESINLLRFGDNSIFSSGKNSFIAS